MEIVPITAEQVDDIVGWAGSLVSDLMPLLIVIFGIAIGAWIIQVIISRFKS